MNDIQIKDNEYIAGTYNRFPITLVKGKGAVLYDSEGKKYIDMGSGIAVNGFGVADEEWKKAVIDQLDKLPHTSNLYYTSPDAELAKMLCERTGMKKVFFCNSGAEANECAIKTARKYSYDKYGEGRHYIITLKNSFHGRTVTTLAATGQDSFHTVFGPFTEGFLYASPDDFSEVEALVSKYPCAAIMMETVQGEGGVNVLDPGYVKKVVELAQKKDMLVIVDEVQTGNGRTGELYSYMHYGFKPDIFTTAKGLGGGLPLGVTVMGEKTAEVLTPGSHGSTFGGNPVCCAGAISILSRIDEKLLAGVKMKSEYIFNELNGAKGVISVSGLGLMIGIECAKPAKDIIKSCMEKGVLVLSAKQKVRLLPSLTITDEELAQAVKILKEAIAE